MSATAGLTTCHGSCQCGAVRFEADVDLSEGTIRCNCSSCTKKGWWGMTIKPGAFRLLAGEDHLVRFGRDPVAEHPRCKGCGLEAFNHGDLPEMGGEYYSLNVRCLDDVDLVGVPVKYLDGRHDTWALLAVEPHVDPFVGAGAPGLKPAWET